MIELIIVVFVVLLCAGLSYGKGPSSGRVTVTKPSSRKVDGFGGAKAYDYSYTSVIKDSRGPFPVGLRLERKKTETWREAERVHEEQ